MSRDLVVNQFRRVVRAAPDGPLVASPKQVWSASDVDSLSRVLARSLREHGVGSGSGIGLAAPNGAGFLAGVLAILRADCVVALIDWRTTKSEKDAVARNLNLEAFLFCDRAWPDSIEDFRLVRAGDGAGPGSQRFEADISLIRITSGSTGTPRGILVSSEAVLADDDQLAITMGLVPDERILASIPLSHSYGFSSIVLPALQRGSVVVVPDENDGPFGPMVAAQHCDATFFPTVPAYLAALLKWDDALDLPKSMRLIVSAGAPLPPSTAARFLEKYDRHVHVFYGASECGGIAYDRGGDAGLRGAIGTPVERVSVELESGPGESGKIGVVVVRSPAVATGYFPEVNDETLGSGRFVSQDVAVVDGNELRLIGRTDDLINVRGKKVSPAEIEAVVSAMDGVEAVVVFGLAAPDGSSRVIRAVLETSTSTLTPDDVIRRCRSCLAPHKIPRSVIIVDRIPRNARGKIDRAALARYE